MLRESPPLPASHHDQGLSPLPVLGKPSSFGTGGLGRVQPLCGQLPSLMVAGFGDPAGGIGVLHLPNLIPLVGSGELAFRRGLVAAAFGSAPRRSASLGEIPSLLDPTYACSPGSESCLIPTLLKQPMASFQDPAPPPAPPAPGPGVPHRPASPLGAAAAGTPQPGSSKRNLPRPNEAAGWDAERLSPSPDGPGCRSRRNSHLPGPRPACNRFPSSVSVPGARCGGRQTGRCRAPSTDLGRLRWDGGVIFLNKTFSTLRLSLVTR